MSVFNRQTKLNKKIKYITRSKQTGAPETAGQRGGGGGGALQNTCATDDCGF